MYNTTHVFIAIGFSSLCIVVKQNCKMVSRTRAHSIIAKKNHLSLWNVVAFLNVITLCVYTKHPLKIHIQTHIHKDIYVAVETSIDHILI